jgi:hypothetical protein
MDGVQDASEAGIPGVTVILYGSDGTTVISSTITDANGQYLFTNLDAGDYVVGFSTLPNSLEFTQQNAAGDNQNNTNSDVNPSTSKTGVINLTAGEVELTIDAGVRTKNPASVGDYVWIDVNKDGFQTAGEFGLPGVIVTLFDAANNPVGAAVTDGKGKYLISNVTPGNGYYIVFSNLPSTSQFTLQTSNVSANDNTLGSDANVANGTTASFNLSAGQYLPSIDAGVVKVQVLPVQLQNFTAVAQANKVLVSWAVAAEINMANYVVEHSVDGISFTAIGTVAANNRSNYSLLHTTPVSGVNYYRLASIDNENKQSYSPVRKVLFDKFNGISIYPNPVKVKANITFTGAIINKQVNVNISSMDGKLVIQQRFNAVNATETIDVSKLANGKYTVQFITDSATTTQVIEVIR